MPLRAFDEGRLFGHIHGTPPPRILALHGWGRSGVDFDRVLAGMSAIALDLPGFGVSPPPANPTGAAGYAERIAPVLSAFPAPPVVLGHSFGGRVAVALADRHPDLVSALVLTGVPLLRNAATRSPSLSYRMVRAAHRAGVISDERMERLRRSRGSADYRASTGVMRDVLVAVVNESYEVELGRIAVPVRLVWGENDLEVPLGTARRAEALLRECGIAVKLDIVPEGGHHLPLEHPLVLRSILEQVMVA